MEIVSRSLGLRSLFTLLAGACGWLLAPDLRGEDNLAFEHFKQVFGKGAVAVAPDGLIDQAAFLYAASQGPAHDALKSFFGDQSVEEVMKDRAESPRAEVGFRKLGSLWFDPALSPDPGMAARFQREWGYQIGKAPLLSDAEGSARLLNGWVRQETRGTLPNVFTADDFEGGAAFAGLTVTVFASPWAAPYFNRQDTRGEIFHFDSQVKAWVQMMRCQRSFPYAEDEMWKTVQLSYGDSDFGLMLAVPKVPKLFHTAPRTMNRQWFEKMRMAAEHRETRLWLPKVLYTDARDWREHWSEMALDSVFSAEADFSPLFGKALGDDQGIGTLSQVVAIRWDEWGTRASSASGIVDPFGSPPEPPKPAEFLANQPFVYILFSGESGEIHYIGTVNQPAQMLVAQPREQ